MDYNDLKKKERLTYEEAATYCGKSVRTVKRWVNKGFFECIRITQGSVFVMRDSIDRLFAELKTKEAERGSEDGPVTAVNLRPLMI